MATCFLSKAALATLSAVALSILPAQSSSDLKTNINPNKKVEDFKTLAEACRNFEEQTHVWLVVSSRLYEEKKRISKLNDEEYAAQTITHFKDKVASEQRHFASLMAVLKAAGFSDWKMYSRYSWKGIGDLDEDYGKVIKDKSHPHYKYTQGQTGLAIDLCKPYTSDNF